MEVKQLSLDVVAVRNAVIQFVMEDRKLSYDAAVGHIRRSRYGSKVFRLLEELNEVSHGINTKT